MRFRHIRPNRKVKEHRELTNWLHCIEDYARIAGLATGIVYVVGLLVVNLDMQLSHGILVLLPLLRAKYLLSGITSLIAVAVPATPFLIISLFLRTPQGLLIQGRRTRAIMFSIIMLFLYSANQLLKIGKYDGGYVQLSLYLATGFLLYCIVIPDDIWSMLRRSRSEVISNLNTELLTHVILLPILLGIYCLFIFPHISPIVGGGKVLPVRMHITNQCNAILQPLDLQVSKDGWTPIVGYVDSTDDAYLIQHFYADTKPHKNRKVIVISIRHELVQAISFVPQ